MPNHYNILLTLFLLLAISDYAQSTFSAKSNITESKNWGPSSATQCELSMLKELIPNSSKYYVTNHTVQTSDGYLLTVFNIVLSDEEHAKLPPNLQANRDRPILLQHGIMDAADGWFMNTEYLSPGYYLVQKGFNVWAGNNRGNKFSLEHIDKTMNDEWFFDYTFQDFAEKDLPAMYDFILKQTGQPKLTYIGHSQGTEQFLSALSDPTDQGRLLAKKIHEQTDQFIAMAPIFYLQKIELPAIAYPFIQPGTIKRLLSMFGVYTLFSSQCSNDTRSKYFVKYFCDYISPSICSLGLKVFGRDDSRDHVQDRIDVMSRYKPAGCSVKNLIHMGQLVKLKDFRNQKFDHGAKMNKEVYGSEQPPVYDPSLIPADMKIAFISGQEDTLANHANTDPLVRILHGGNFNMYWLENWDHISFTFGRDIQKLFRILDKELKIDL